MKICGKDNIKEVIVEIVEDTRNDPNAFPSPIENICGIWQKKNEDRYEDNLYLLIAD